MSISRNISRSIEYRLWQILVQADWVLTSTGESLTAVPDTALTYTSSDIVHPWCFLDASGLQPTRSRIKVYVGGTLQNPNTYDINFMDRTVTFHASPGAGAVTADIDYFACGVVENFQEEENQVVPEVLEMVELPVIAYGLTGFRGTAFGIGTTALDRAYPLSLDALCDDDGQKKDMGDDLVERIAAIPLIDFSSGWLLTTGLDANTSFDPVANTQGYLRVTSRGLSWPNPRKGGSDKERHRALITAMIKTAV